MNKMIFPNELLIEAVIRAREIETEYYEWEIKEQEPHRFSRKYQKEINKLRDDKVVHHINQKRSLRFKVALVAAIVMLMGSMTVLAVSPIREKVQSFMEQLFFMESEVTGKIPTKTEVYEKRVEVLSGMSEDEIHRLRENIKVLNLEFEQKYLYENCFEKWSDPNDLYWSSTIDKEATDFIQLIAELKESMKTDLLDGDFNNLVNNMVQAKETHKVEYLEEIYHILHDMDYYLLRYGPEDVAIYMVDDSIVVKYYGVLEVYQE